MALDQNLLSLLEDEARWAVDDGLAERSRMPGNYLDFIETGPLESSDGEAVTVVRGDAGG